MYYIPSITYYSNTNYRKKSNNSSYRTYLELFIQACFTPIAENETQASSFSKIKKSIYQSQVYLTQKMTKICPTFIQISNFLLESKFQELNLPSGTSEYIAITKVVKDQKQAMQNFKIQLSISGINNIVLYPDKSQYHDKAGNIAEA